MRPAMLARVLVFGALTASLLHSQTLAQAQAGGGRGKNPSASKPTASFTPIAKTVTGTGASKDGAIQSALVKAREEFAEALKRPQDQIPDVEYLRQHCLTDLEDKEDGKWEEDAIDNKRVLLSKQTFERAEVAKDAYQVRLRVELSQKDFTEITKKIELAREDARRQIVEHRQWWLAKFLLGAVVFLGTLSGYIRLEDATKGYYTGWLRLGMVGVLCAVCAGLWLAS